MTPRELDMLLYAELDNHARKHGRLTRPEMSELWRIGQEAMEKERGNG